VSDRAKSICEPEAREFRPVRMLEVELSQPIPAVPTLDEAGRTYHTALSLVRLHTEPLGRIELHLGSRGLSPAEYAATIWSALGDKIAAHLRQDGLPEVARLDETGIPCGGTPPCVQERQRFLSTAPFVSVIIPTANRTDHLDRCLQSLLNMEYPHFEIVVVDNLPKIPTTFNLLEEKYGKSSQVCYVREERPGQAAARNRGIVAAKGEIVAFTDDDVLVDRHWLAEMVKGFAVSENVACVTGLVLPKEIETPSQKWFEQYGGFSKGFTRRIYDLKENSPDNPMYPYNVGGFGSGNNMAFRRSILHSLGGFDPILTNVDYKLSGEDVEVFLRIITKGYSLAYEPSAIVHHLHRRDYAGLRKQIYSYGLGLTAVFFKFMMDHPYLLPDFISKIPAGVRFALSSDSSKNAQKNADYPKELTRLERRGMIMGPLIYLRARWKTSLRPRAMRRYAGP
jgi:GT2 family glycosyltransferase